MHIRIPFPVFFQVHTMSTFIQRATAVKTVVSWSALSLHPRTPLAPVMWEKSFFHVTLLVIVLPECT